MRSPILSNSAKSTNPGHGFPRLAALALAIILPNTGVAQEYFNPRFLSNDPDTVADLSFLQQGAELPPGNYSVEIWLNNEYIDTASISFKAKTEAPLQNAEAQTKTAEAAAGTEDKLIPCLDMEWMNRLGLNVAAYPALKNLKAGECVPLAKIIPKATTHLNTQDLKLEISIPQSALLNNGRGYIPPEQWDDGITAGLLNYDFSGNQSTDNDSYYLNLRSGFNLGPWRLRNNAAWNYSSGKGYTQNKWQNLNTYVERAIRSIKSQLVLGESNTDGTLFDSLGFRGARLYSSDEMYPDSLQGFAPTVRGVARTNAKVIIKQNGYTIYQSYVAPGSFAIKDLNSTSASGDLEVIVEEKDGSTQHYVVPYSTVPILQREGRIKYDLSAGNYRSGRKNQSNLFFTQGTLLKGMTNGYTLYGGYQFADRYQSIMFGTGKNLATWGAIAVDITQANSKLVDGSSSQGQSARFTYAKTLNQHGTNFQLVGYRYSTSGFYTLSDIAYRSMQGYEFATPSKSANGVEQPRLIDYHNLYNNKRGRFQASISQQLGGFGSLNASVTQQTYWNTKDADDTFQLSYSNAWKGISYSLSSSWTKSAYQSGTDQTLFFNLSVPLQLLSWREGRRDALENAYLNSSLSNNADGSTAWQTGISGSLLEDNNLTYGFSEGRAADHTSTRSLNANWQATYANVGVNYNEYGKNQHELSWSASGGILAHANGITFGQPLGDTNVLVKAPGAADVKIDNQTGVKTDWRGYAIVPYATTYRHNRIALDVDSLDSHTEVKGNVKDVIPTRGAIVRASYKTQIGIRALITLTHNGINVPFGAVVTEAQSGVSSLADDEGQTYLSGLPLKGKLLVKWGNSALSQCTANYQLPQDSLKKEATLFTAPCI